MACSFVDNCLCGYKFTSSNRNWVWKREALSNFTADDEENKDNKDCEWFPKLSSHNESECLQTNSWSPENIGR